MGIFVTVVEVFWSSVCVCIRFIWQVLWQSHMTDTCHGRFTMLDTPDNGYTDFKRWIVSIPRSSRQSWEASQLARSHLASERVVVRARPAGCAREGLAGWRSDPGRRVLVWVWCVQWCVVRANVMCLPSVTTRVDKRDKPLKAEAHFPQALFSFYLLTWPTLDWNFLLTFWFVVLDGWEW